MKLRRKQTLQATTACLFVPPALDIIKSISKGGRLYVQVLLRCSQTPLRAGHGGGHAYVYVHHMSSCAQC
eukprot:6945547-Karenia_brevis.AAC.1